MIILHMQFLVRSLQFSCACCMYSLLSPKLAWRVKFPDAPEEPARMTLRDLQDIKMSGYIRSKIGAILGHPLISSESSKYCRKCSQSVAYTCKKTATVPFDGTVAVGYKDLDPSMI